MPFSRCKSNHSVKVTKNLVFYPLWIRFVAAYFSRSDHFRLTHWKSAQRELPSANETNNYFIRKHHASVCVSFEFFLLSLEVRLVPLSLREGTSPITTIAIIVREPTASSQETAGPQSPKKLGAHQQQVKQVRIQLKQNAHPLIHQARRAVQSIIFKSSLCHFHSWNVDYASASIRWYRQRTSASTACKSIEW